MQDQLETEINGFAATNAQEIAAAFGRNPRDPAAHRERLEDAKLAIVREAEKLADFPVSDGLVWQLAGAMPDLDDSVLYKARASLPALASAVLLGWLLGGFVSTFLGFLGLGGEILRPAAILLCLWLEEYLGTNPKARRIMLSVLGLGALGRFAASLASGLARFTSLGSLRQLIFGAGAHPGFFRSVWLWLGALFLLIFFAKKTTGLDLPAFRESLERQIAGRISLLLVFFEELNRKEEQIREITDSALPSESRYCPKEKCPLADAAISLLDTLDEKQGAWLAGALASAGYEVTAADSGYLIWGPEAEAEYEPVGLVRPGDRCMILKRPVKREGRLIKGRAQRLPEVAR